MPVFVCCFAFLFPEIPKRQQIIRVKIQSKLDVSSQEAKAAILEQVGLILHKPHSYCTFCSSLLQPDPKPLQKFKT